MGGQPHDLPPNFIILGGEFMATSETIYAIKRMETQEEEKIREKIRNTVRARKPDSCFAGNTTPCKIESLQMALAKRKKD